MAAGTGAALDVTARTRWPALNRLDLRVRRRSFRTIMATGASYATDEDTSIDWPYRRVIGARNLHVMEATRAKRRSGR